MDDRKICVTILRNAATTINELAAKVESGAVDETGFGFTRTTEEVSRELSAAYCIFHRQMVLGRSFGDLVLKIERGNGEAKDAYEAKS